ncbi:MAG: hypothetical protein ACOYM2_08260 [Rectinemataceae bacterium]
MTVPLYANPWLWLLLGSLALGGGLAMFLRILLRQLGQRRRRPEGLPTAGMVLVSIAVLSTTGLFVFPDKEVLGESGFRIVGLLSLGLGFLAGLFPRAFGLPLLPLLVLAIGLAATGLDGWAAVEGKHVIATITPYSVDASGMHGELSLAAPGAGPAVRALELPGTEAGLEVERLALGGPLTLLGSPSRYRVAAVSSAAATGPGLILPPRSSILDTLLPLGPGGSGESGFAFIRRWRESAAPERLEALVQQRFTLDPAAPRGGQLGSEGGQDLFN